MWHLEMQTEKQGKNEVEVLCKHIRFFPKMGSTGQVEGFGKLKPLVLGLLLRSDAGYEVKVTMCVQHGDIQFTSYTITHPDTMGKPMIVIGQGKNRRKIKDELSPDVKIPGQKEKFPYEMDFEKRMLQFGGPTLLAEVMDAFVARRNEIMGKRAIRLAA
jgi:hypothetical protein